jgi:hypothetical protein
MLDAMPDTISASVLTALKRRPESFDAQRWIPRLVDEIERLRECLKKLDERSGASARGANNARQVSENP